MSLLCCRCKDGIEGLHEQGQTNAIVCKFIQEFDTLFEVCYGGFVPLKEMSEFGKKKLLKYRPHLPQCIAAILSILSILFLVIQFLLLVIHPVGAF